MARRRSSKKVGLHGHRCTQCKQRYEDACEESGTKRGGGTKLVAGPNRLCPHCATGNPNPWWYEGRLPRDCCYANARSVTKEELEIYRLAGDAGWWICPHCHRTHPFDPTRRATA